MLENLLSLLNIRDIMNWLISDSNRVNFIYGVLIKNVKSNQILTELKIVLNKKRF